MTYVGAGCSSDVDLGALIISRDVESSLVVDSDGRDVFAPGAFENERTEKATVVAKLHDEEVTEDGCHRATSEIRLILETTPGIDVPAPVSRNAQAHSILERARALPAEETVSGVAHQGAEPGDEDVADLVDSNAPESLVVFTAELSGPAIRSVSIIARNEAVLVDGRPFTSAEVNRAFEGTDEIDVSVEVNDEILAKVLACAAEGPCMADAGIREFAVIPTVVIVILFNVDIDVGVAGSFGISICVDVFRKDPCHTRA